MGMKQMVDIGQVSTTTVMILFLKLYLLDLEVNEIAYKQNK